ncbi:MAG: hypothetical protein Unbinned2819contig1004_44 [Prokaryotic dsDNA virus sp.]|nr:MAG: hypothetical protein Unbinned2819contig1004_44 [Prokaryotic dsDNA virus sp.]|tara:strand:- start:18855 stop:19598 length:744 start_codon:yes stop_codon:yes gene_type:complete
MEATIKIPTDINEIPLGSYQKFMKTVEKSNDEEFICHKLVEIFCGLKLRDVFEVRWSDVKEVTIHLSKLFKTKPKHQLNFSLQNVEFGFIPDLENMSFGEYIDLTQNINKVENWHKAMAVMYRPITKKYKDKYDIQKYVGTANYSEVMKYAPLGVALGAQVFFCNLTNSLLQALNTYLKKEMKTIMTSVQDDNLENNGVGINQYMQSQMETLQNLTKLPNFQYENVLHTLLLKSKKEISKIVKCSEN